MNPTVGVFFLLARTGSVERLRVKMIGYLLLPSSVCPARLPHRDRDDPALRSFPSEPGPSRGAVHLGSIATVQPRPITSARRVVLPRKTLVDDRRWRRLPWPTEPWRYCRYPDRRGQSSSPFFFVVADSDSCWLLLVLCFPLVRYATVTPGV